MAKSKVEMTRSKLGTTTKSVKCKQGINLLPTHLTIFFPKVLTLIEPF